MDDLAGRRPRSGVQFLPRAGTPVEQTGRVQLFGGGAIVLAAIALTAGADAGTKCLGRKDVRTEAKPVQIVEDGNLERSPRAFRVVILDPQQDLAVEQTRSAPHDLRIEHVTEVKMSGRRRRKPRPHRARFFRRTDLRPRSISKV
jgi:hypothetical protein